MKGQTAFEYLMMFSIVLTILTLLTYYAQDMTNRNMEEVIVSDATIAVNKIAEASDIVYTQGSPSQITLSAYIPNNVYSIEFSNNMIIMRINVSSRSNDIFATSKALLCCQPTCLNPNLISSGTKEIKIRVGNCPNGVTYVNITQS